MADVVLIAEGTYKEGINNIGDVVEIQEDGIIGGGVGYANFTVINIPGTKAEVEALLNAKIPEQKRCFRSKANADEWSDEPPEEAEFWNDNGTWRKIEVSPKFQRNVSLDAELADALKNEALTDEYKLSLLGSKASSNLVTASENRVAVSIVEAVKEVEKVGKI